VPELLVVRHAIAEDREEFAATGEPDDRRPLTKRGRNRMREGARGLASLMDPPEFVATSPLARAVQTAEIVAKAFGAAAPLEVDALGPDGDFEILSAWVRGRGPDARIAVVGHEPHLSGYVSMLLGGKGSFLQLKKGAACLLTVAPSVTPGSGLLLWALAPAQLRRLAAT
jgi:phosphohistidine phosphatase